MAHHNHASSVVVAHSSDEGECPPGGAPPRISEIELMKTVNIGRVEEGRIRRMPLCRAVLRRVI
jgi:hypothetical protein